VIAYWKVVIWKMGPWHLQTRATETPLPAREDNHGVTKNLPRQISNSVVKEQGSRPFERESGDRSHLRILPHDTIMALGTGVAVEIAGRHRVNRPTFRTGPIRRSRIHHETLRTLQADVGTVVPDAAIKRLVIRVIGVVFVAVVVDVIRIAVIPDFNRERTR